MKQILKESNTVIFNMFYKYVLKILPHRFSVKDNAFSKKNLGQKSQCYIIGIQRFWNIIIELFNERKENFLQH